MSDAQQPRLSPKNNAKRQLLLNGSIWRGVFSVCLPLAAFQLIQQLFRIVDLSITAHISVHALTAVSFLSQLSNTFGAVGTGFAIGVGIIIAGHYGAGEYTKVKQVVNSVFALTLLVSVVLAAILIAFAPVILALANTPPAVKELGMAYYICEMAGLVFVYLNAVYIAIEKARGNGKIILWLNIILAVVKLSLSALFIFVLQQGIVMVSVATLIANFVVAGIGFLRLRESSDVFGLSLSYVSLRWKTLRSTILISLPVMAEKIAFSAGKVMVNSVGTAYGAEVVGALGVSNSISSISTMPPSSIGDGGAAIIRQNLGAGNKHRALKVFRSILIINLVFGMIAFLATLVFLDPLVAIFSKGDMDFAQLIKQIYLFEMISNVFLAVNASVMGLLYGFGYTKISFAMNFARLFVFRLPLLIFLQHFTAMEGGAALGIVMMVSNGATGLTALLVGVVVIYRQYGWNGFKELVQ